MTPTDGLVGVHKTRTGVPGLDQICRGGLPVGRTTLVAGTAGAAKTVLGAHFLAAGITTQNDRGVFVTFEESPEAIRDNLAGFGWDVASWERDGWWKFVDASLDTTAVAVTAGGYDFGALLARVERAVTQLGAQRVCLDSIGSVFGRFTDAQQVRRELHRLGEALRQLGVTTIVTAERETDDGPLARFGVAEFIADNVILLRNTLDAENRRRTIEVLKFRGTDHHKGEYPFTVTDGQGVVVLPLSSLLLEQGSSGDRVATGNSTLDEMCSGGLFQDSVTLVSGPTGTGKTLLGAGFLHATRGTDERALLFSFEESRDQFYRNASSWGFDFNALEADGRFTVKAVYPELMGLEDHLVQIRAELDASQPDRIVIDSLSALRRVSTDKSFREFMIALTSMLKDRRICTLMTIATNAGAAPMDEIGSHVSTITDAIILLRYVEFYGEIRRGITVLKMRGSNHDREIHEFAVTDNGMEIGETFRNVNGILSGAVDVRDLAEIERIKSMFVDIDLAE